MKPILSLAVLLFFVSGIYGGNIEVTRVTAQDEDGTCRVVIASSAPIAVYKAFMLDNPGRLVIDIQNAKSRLPGTIRVTSGCIGRIRTSQFSLQPAVVRVVLDLSTKVRFRTVKGASLQFILSGKAIARKTRTSGGIPSDLDLVRLPGGTFRMGDTVNYDEKPVRPVTVDAFSISRYEVTNAQYARFLNEYGSDEDAEGNKLVYFSDRQGLKQAGDRVEVDPGYGKHPVANVTWYGADAFCRFYGLRLPTEAEWEYACRAGSEGKYYFTDTTRTGIEQHAWYGKNAVFETHPVGEKQANAYGLFDMCGNVWEWCSDWFNEQYYAAGHNSNPAGPPGGAKKVLRGGSWSSDASDLRCAGRNREYPQVPAVNYGFRCAQ